MAAKAIAQAAWKRTENCVKPGALRGSICEGAVEQDPGVIDALIQGVGVLLGFGHREQGEPVVDRELNLDIAPVILHKRLPTSRVTARQVPGAATVQHAGGGRTELFDQPRTRHVLLNVEVKSRTDRIQAHRQTEVGRPHHRAAPLARVQKPGRQQLGAMTLQP